MTKQRLTVLGSTGSIGTSTLDVVARHLDRFEVFALSAATQVDALLAQYGQAPVLHSDEYKAYVLVYLE